MVVLTKELSEVKGVLNLLKERNYANLLGKKFKDVGKLPYIENLVREVVTNVKHATGVDFISKFSFYEEEGDFSHVKIILTTSKKDKVSLRKDIYISKNDSVDDLLTSLDGFILEYKKLKVFEEKLNNLNKEMLSICRENNVGYVIEFAYGEGILEVTDTYILFGLDEEKIMSLDSLNLFHTNDLLKQGYRKAILDTLKLVDYPYELVKVKNHVTKDLGIFSNKKVVSLIKGVYNRNGDKMRVGKGFIETDDTFAVVLKEAIREDEVIAYDYFYENESPTNEEEKYGKLKIGVTYLIKPFDKKTLLKK